MRRASLLAAAAGVAAVLLRVCTRDTRKCAHLVLLRAQAPDCKHGLGSKIKVGLCAMDKKVMV
jgi:hypothetical protein